MYEQNQNREYRNGIQLIIFASVLWGTVGIATQIVYQQSDITAFTVGFFRLSLALPVVAILCWSIVGRKVLLVGRRHYLRMAVIGVMLALYQVCYFSSISYVGVSIATLVTLCSAPAIVALLSVVWLKERLTRRMLLAFAFAVSGTCLLVGIPVGLTTQGDLITDTGRPDYRHSSGTRFGNRLCDSYSGWEIVVRVGSPGSFNNRLFCRWRPLLVTSGNGRRHDLQYVSGDLELVGLHRPGTNCNCLLLFFYRYASH